ncbi:hypothetical protein JCM3770_002935 [Rhodotorula araucariae]
MSIHDPAAATHAPAEAAPTPTVTVQSELRRLTEHRSTLEAQLDVYSAVLRANNIDMHAPLVDPEGFPRSDIDVAGVRTARVHILRLRNDLDAVLADLHQVVLRGLPRGPEPDRASGDQRMQARDDADEAPFAQVDAVAPGSPADSAGIQRGDLVVALGTVTSANHDHLRAVAALVGRSEGATLPVVILRRGDRLELSLTPKSGWGGRGLLGCHIVPHMP